MDDFLGKNFIGRLNAFSRKNHERHIHFSNHFPFPLVLEGRKKTMEKVATIMERWAITKVISVDILWGLIYLWNTVFCQEQRTNASSKYLKTGAN